MTPIPPVLTLTELAALLKLSPRTIYARRRDHSHPAIVELPRFTGSHVRFDGRAVETWLSGGPQVVRRRPHLSAHRRQPGTSLLSVQRRRVG